MGKIHLKIVSLLLSSIIIVGCTAFGSKTIMKSANLNYQPINNLGISQIASEEILNQIISNTSIHYKNSVDEFFYYRNIKISHCRLPDYYYFESIDPSEITKLCTELNLDGFICTTLKYKFTKHTINFIPYGKSEDVIVEMKLFSRNGVELLHVSHDSQKGNVYMLPPKASKTIRDGTMGALKRIMKEINK